MNIFIEDEEIEEIKIEDLLRKSEDKGKVIIKSENQGKRGEGEDNLTKEITAYDAMNIGASRASEINSVPISSASKYANGKDIDDDETRTRVLATKYDIADKAVARLMDTLNLFDPTAMEKQTDIIKAAGTLAGIVERVSVREKSAGNEVHLHLYAPKQNKIEKYQIIDV